MREVKEIIIKQYEVKCDRCKTPYLFSSKDIAMSSTPYFCYDCNTVIAHQEAIKKTIINTEKIVGLIVKKVETRTLQNKKGFVEEVYVTKILLGNQNDTINDVWLDIAHASYDFGNTTTYFIKISDVLKEETK